MHDPQSVRFHRFASDPHPLRVLADAGRPQAIYLIRYLADIGAASVIEEPYYFDRDYLSEFSAFYGVSAHGYSNTCRRLHFFTGQEKVEERFRLALSGDQEAHRSLFADCVGFCVLRPIPGAPLGRTVIKEYPEKEGQPRRVLRPARDYHTHVGGLRFTVKAVAWQQQDTGVGACATIALWSLFHSVSHDDQHAIPTTAEITASAHRTASLGDRVFPAAQGLRIEQILEAIKEAGLAPALVKGEMAPAGTKRTEIRFGHGKFATTAATLLRSGFPMLLAGAVPGGRHAVCAVGFRPSLVSAPAKGTVLLEDSGATVYYIHDDNIGPAIRHELKPAVDGGVELKRVPPVRPSGCPLPQFQTGPTAPFIPTHIVAALPEDIRVSPDRLLEEALVIARTLAAYHHLVPDLAGFGLVVSAKYLRLAEFLGEGLDSVLAGNGAALTKARMALINSVRPMSLYLGVVRVGLVAPDGRLVPLLDVLCDTTEGNSELPVFATVRYNEIYGWYAGEVAASGALNLGVPVDGF